MATAVITGGTDGIGRALADTYLDRGHEVLIVGTSEGKGRAFVESAGRRGAGDRARFLQADLSLVAENRRVIDRIAEQYRAVDVLVLGARYHRSTRAETPDGFESNFALYYLSRYLLSHGLVGLLGRAERATVLNFGGSGLTGPVRWNDLQLRRNYPGTGALGHGAALCDLLGVHFTRAYADTPVHYVLNHPGVVSTSFAGEYDAFTAAHVDGLRTSGKPVSLAVAQILPYLDAPPARLTAVLEGRQLPTDTPAFDPAAAERLHTITEKLLADLPR
ncbi:SDR family NAD(P)-dependent oxidoreductase [Streptomyces sp. CB01881]|uniref:SDR family NAD(P)-dependent oxidoreductase n=1 Tax=Streptomyces sp. CB01881 TaxID=2078691 RepID=UPI000CDC0300|nr:SDR family NAD(P)-dependent oxidoreductase [Streptomyces sp. CB01881]AUY52707.1 oxidoreductase [Streptomyces sp. CB01881]TYC70425.1 SDR family NAD(P)-dependent oxidoreductase [Streptomyces sp. CB01881]